jgi:replicative DNA helicase
LSDESNFDYYYNKLKKINLLKSLQRAGYDISEFYVEDTLNPRYQEINAHFEEVSATDITNSFRKKLNRIEGEIGINQENKVCHANDGVKELLASLKLAPDTGPRLQGKIFNTVVRGARKGKFFLRSASSGLGKTRRAVGDACYLSYPIRYNIETSDWDWDGATEKSLIIVTEQEEDEIQTMILAYLSGVNEDKILFSSYNEAEEKRIQQALQIMDTYKDNLRICRMPNPNIEQIQQVIRSEVLENGAQYIFYDYIFLNPALLNEFRDLKMADHQVLGMMSAALKDLAVELNVFIFSSTQLNAQGEDNTKAIKNESAIRGSRAIVDKVDMGCIVNRPSDDDLHMVGEFCTKIPNTVTDIYKMRRGRYTQVRIWSYTDLGTCRTEDLLITDGKLKPVSITIIKQEYPEDRWDIADMVMKLNNGEVEEPHDAPAPTSFTERTRERIEEKNNNLFGGLL